MSYVKELEDMYVKIMESHGISVFRHVTIFTDMVEKFIPAIQRCYDKQAKGIPLRSTMHDLQKYR